MFDSRSGFLHHDNNCAWLLVVSFAIFLTGCGSASVGGSTTGGGGGNGGGETGGPSSGEYLWQVGNDEFLYYSAINTETGALGSLTRTDGYVGEIGSLVASPSGNDVYACCDSVGELLTFETSGPGLQIRSVAQAEISYFQSMALHPSGKFLYVGEDGVQGQTPLVVYSITSTTGGAPDQSSSITVQNGDFSSLAIDPSGRFLFVGDFRGMIFGYQIDQTSGVLTPLPNMPLNLPTGYQPTQLLFGGSENSLFLYAFYETGSSYSTLGVQTLSMDGSNGGLTPISSSGIQPGCSDYASVDPSRRFLYTLSYQCGAIRGYLIDPTSGALTEMSGSPFTTGPSTSLMTVDPTGRFLYVAVDTNQINAATDGFGIDANTGNLSAVAGSPFPSAPYPEGAMVMNVP